MDEEAGLLENEVCEDLTAAPKGGESGRQDVAEVKVEVPLQS